MAHVLLTLNEPLLQRSKARGPLGLSLTTICCETFFLPGNCPYLFSSFFFARDLPVAPAETNH